MSDDGIVTIQDSIESSIEEELKRVGREIASAVVWDTTDQVAFYVNRLRRAGVGVSAQSEQRIADSIADRAWAAIESALGGSVSDWARDTAHDAIADADWADESDDDDDSLSVEALSESGDRVAIADAIVTLTKALAEL